MHHLPGAGDAGCSRGGAPHAAPMLPAADGGVEGKDAEARDHREHATPALWVVVWIGAAIGFLVGFTDGPGGAFLPAIGSMLDLDTPFAHIRSRLLDMCDDTKRDVEIYLVIKPLAAALSALFTACAGRRLGRRRTMAIGCAVFIIASLTEAFSQTKAGLYLGRAFNGGAEGLLMCVYVGAVEVAPKHNRGRLAAFDQLGRGMGVLSQGLLLFGLQSQGRWAWRLYNVFGAYVAGFLLLLLSCGGMADTPASLAQRGRLDEAREALQALRNPLYSRETEAEFQALLEECAASAKEQGRSALSRRWLPRTLLAVFLAISYNALGGVLNKFNMPAMLYRSVFITSSDWIYLYYTLLMGGGSLIGAVVLLLWVDSLGRRKLLVYLSLANILIVSISGSMIVTQAGFRSLPAMATVIIGLALLTATHAAGPQGTMWTYISEIQPLADRSLVFGAAVCVNELAQAAVEAVLLITSCERAKKLVTVLVISNILAAGLFWFLLPETARRDAAEINAEFDAHWLWGRFTRKPPRQSRQWGAGSGARRRSSSSGVD
ncbi:hypothetical protein Rsub_11721 [Raphidocelis subcapitata]|uniref:Major facilitator superfamily (MFS) profile domain-containing protein n=1 Tax=Raphidocelis subcapitata TaxID=307507 RepID=A0A2V0PH76_9CHLO|nr:hypothetical protein Rsub_11721 [Raphidocelis subcapitata]|eukprot:GBF98929.1 hypothetical protein Rsub_11721 [Raphidocelis subcapitata]